MTRLAQTLMVLFVLSWPMTAAAQQRLDDSNSPRQQVTAELEWAHPMTSGMLRDFSAERFNAVKARVRNLDIRLDTSRYVGSTARVFMTVPLPVKGLRSSSSMRIDWQADGVFEDGTLVPGSRALVYKGPIRDKELRSELDMTVSLDAREVTGELRFDPMFEIEAAGD